MKALLSNSIFDKFDRQVLDNPDDISPANFLLALELQMAASFFSSDLQTYLKFENFLGRLLILEPRFMKDFLLLLLMPHNESSHLDLMRRVLQYPNIQFGVEVINVAQLAVICFPLDKSTDFLLKLVELMAKVSNEGQIQLNNFFFKVFSPNMQFPSKVKLVRTLSRQPQILFNPFLNSHDFQNSLGFLIDLGLLYNFKNS